MMQLGQSIFISTQAQPEELLSMDVVWKYTSKDMSALQLGGGFPAQVDRHALLKLVF